MIMEIAPWLEQAACRDSSTPDLWHTERALARREAIAICNTCPVKDDCLADALEEETKFGARPWGIRGGRTEEQRRALIRRRDRKRYCPHGHDKTQPGNLTADGRCRICTLVISRRSKAKATT